MTPSLLRRFPLLPVPRSTHAVVPMADRARYPSLASDFEILDRVVAEQFAAADVAAQRNQHRYRRQQVLILIGAALVSGVGALQAMESDQRWPGVVLTVLSIVTAAVGRTSHELDTFTGYLDERIKAERLRALHFRFLSRTGPFAGADRETALQYAALDIKSGKEPR